MNKIISIQYHAKVHRLMEIIFNQIDRIHHIQFIVQHQMNHQIVAIVVMSKVFLVRLLLYILKLLNFILIDYYKLNRLYKALAIQKLQHPMGKMSPNVSANYHQHPRRLPAHNQYKPHHQQQKQQQQHATNYNIPTSSTDLSSSPPTPTPMNINQLSPFYAQQSSYLPMPTTVTDSRKSKY